NSPYKGPATIPVPGVRRTYRRIGPLRGGVESVCATSALSAIACILIGHRTCNHREPPCAGQLFVWPLLCHAIGAESERSARAQRASLEYRPPAPQCHGDKAVCVRLRRPEFGYDA